MVFRSRYQGKRCSFPWFPHPVPVGHVGHCLLPTDRDIARASLGSPGPSGRFAAGRNNARSASVGSDRIVSGMTPLSAKSGGVCVALLKRKRSQEAGKLEDDVSADR